VSARPIRTIITVIMDVLVVLAVALTARLIVEFFGVLASSQVGTIVIDLTNWLVPVEFVSAIKTPYGGVFDISTAIMIVILLFAEWILSVIRARV
jgi:hypothetical protein